MIAPPALGLFPTIPPQPCGVVVIPDPGFTSLMEEADIIPDKEPMVEEEGQDAESPEAEPVAFAFVLPPPAASPPPGDLAEAEVGTVLATAPTPTAHRAALHDPDSAVETDSNTPQAPAAPPSAETALRLQMAAPDTPPPEAAEPAPDVAAMDQAAAVSPPDVPFATVAPQIPPDTHQIALPADPPPPPAEPGRSPLAVPRQVAEGLSNALATTPGSDRIELVLSPEELGRVRFELRAEGDNLQVTLTAERPETMELLRRHLPELLTELRQAGYGAATLNFGQSGNPGGGAAFEAPDDGDAPPPSESLPVSRPAPVQAGGLNLRL